MNDLEGQKSLIEMELNEYNRKRKRFTVLSILVAVAFASFLILSFVIERLTKVDVGLYRMILFAVTAVAVGVLFVFMSNLSRDSRKDRKKLNNTISLLNVVRMKYVNVTKAVDYVADKYDVESSYKLLYVWEQYLEAVKEKERFEKNNEDLEYFSGRLIRLLKQITDENRIAIESSMEEQKQVSNRILSTASDITELYREVDVQMESLKNIVNGNSQAMEQIASSTDNTAQAITVQAEMQKEQG